MSAPGDPETPPWEQPDVLRRDYLPHRGGMLHLLSSIAVLAGGLSLCCGPCGLVGLPVGAFVWIGARRDLKEMETGTIDPRGEEITIEALALAQIGAAASLVALIFWTLILVAAT